MNETATTEIDMELDSIEDNTAEISGELSSDQVDKAFQKVFNQLSQRVDIDGFRPGKVPPQVLENRIGIEPIRNQVRENLQNYLVDKALEEFGLELRPGPEITFSPVSDLERGEPFRYELELPIYPDFEVPDFTDFELTVEQIEVSDERRDDYVDQLRERFRELDEKSEGGAEIDDLFVGSLKSEFLDDEADGGTPPFQHDEIRYKLGVEPELEGFAERLEGIEPGETRDFDYTIPEDYPHDENLRGREIHVTADCEQVFEVHLPEVDEEFISERLGLESREQFDQQIDQAVEQQVDEENKQTKFNAVMDRMVQEAEIDISDEWLDSEVEQELADQRQRLQQEEGISLQAWLDEQSIDRDEYEEQLREELEGRLRSQLLIRRIAQNHGLEPTDQEISMALYQYMSQNDIPSEKGEELAQNEFLMNRLRFDLMRTKVREHLIDAIEFEEVEPLDSDVDPEEEGKLKVDPDPDEEGQEEAGEAEETAGAEPSVESKPLEEEG